MGGRAARIGSDQEKGFENLVNTNSRFRELLTNCLNRLEIIRGEVISATWVKNNRFKSDVDLSVNDVVEGQITVGCSIKAAKANFNQMDRRWLSDWAELLNMPAEVSSEIQSSLDRKLINSRAVFITPRQGEIIIPFLEENKERIVRELFTRDEQHTKVFVAYDRSGLIWYIASIEEVINAIVQSPITLTRQGVVRFGDYLSLQRKGGDGNITNPPKSSPLHPSNHLQFKIKPLSIINSVSAMEIRL